MKGICRTIPAIFIPQVKSMVNLIDDISANALKSMVAGEVLDTAAPLGNISVSATYVIKLSGVKMKMAKLSGSNTVGEDLDGDGRSVKYRLTLS